MMEIQSDGIFLGQKNLGDSKYVAKVFSQDFGLISGLFRVPKHSGNLQAGEYVRVRWRARLEEHLGQSSIERLGGFDPLGLTPRAMQGLLSMSYLLQTALNEREAEARLYEATLYLLAAFSSADWARHYLEWERTFLETMGFGLDLSTCASVGCNMQNLQYISPKSARAVCREHGAPYRDQLFEMPKCWQEQSTDIVDIVAGLHITGYFLKRAFSFVETMPEFRRNLLENLADTP